eukprot:8308226-Alexandrium_andersonii.AAC.1
MSASLVGSEMCIRDRFMAAARNKQQRAHVLVRVIQSSILRVLEADSKAPVSYTHLTLPTICSV